MPDMNEHAETQQEYFCSRMNGKSQMCIEALIKLEAVKSASTETLLKELKNRGVISSWYYNGSYHVGSALQ